MTNCQSVVILDDYKGINSHREGYGKFIRIQNYLSVGICVKRTHSWSKSSSKTKRFGGIPASLFLDRSLCAQTNPHQFSKNKEQWINIDVQHWAFDGCIQIFNGRSTLSNSVRGEGVDRMTGKLKNSNNKKCKVLWRTKWMSLFTDILTLCLWWVVVATFFISDHPQQVSQTALI